MGLFKDMKGAIGGAKSLGDHHGGMPSIGGAFKDIKALADDRGEGEVLKNGTPAKAIVKSFATPSATEKFAMQIDLEIHPPGGAPYLITYVYPTARQKAAMSVGMEVPVKYLPDDPGARRRAVGRAEGLDRGGRRRHGGRHGRAPEHLLGHRRRGDAPGDGEPGRAGRAVDDARRRPGPAARRPQDPAERLKKLAELRDAGAITDAEYEAKKAEILRQI